MTPTRAPLHRRAIIALATLTLLLVPATARAAGPATVTVKGKKDTWRLALLNIRSMYRIPHTSWSGYQSNFYRFFVLTVRLTNTGHVSVAPADDLVLAMAVRPPHVPHYAAYAAGFGIPSRTDRALVAIMQTAAHIYGGAVPWTRIAPHHTTVYCYVIGTNRGDSNYGLYNAPPLKRKVFLLDTGL